MGYADIEIKYCNYVRRLLPFPNIIFHVTPHSRIINKQSLICNSQFFNRIYYVRMYVYSFINIEKYSEL